MDRRNRMGRHGSALVAAVVALALAGIPRVRAQIERRGLQPPELIQLSGHVGTPLPGETGGWNLKLGVRFTPTLYDYHLVDIRVVNSGRLGEQILFSLAGYEPTFYLFGSPEQLAVLASATAQDRLTITGWRRAGSRALNITELSSAPAPSPTAR
jgi:hypothetical protein